MVSLLIPCYNHEKFLEDCLQSLIDQSYDEIELLINDDASTDQSWSMIEARKEQLENRFKRVYLHRNTKNQGVTKSLNILLKQAAGDYIKIIASDDMLHRDYIKTCVEYMEQHSKCSAVVTNAFVVTENIWYARDLKSEEFFYKEPPNFNKEEMLTRVYLEDIIAAPSTFVRKEVYDSIGNYDEKLGAEDWDYWLRMLENGMEFDYLDRVLVYYRKNSNSASSTMPNSRMQKRCLRILKYELEVIDKHSKYVPIEVYWARRNRTVMGQFYIAVNHSLPRLRVVTRWQQFRNACIKRRIEKEV